MSSSTQNDLRIESKIMANLGNNVDNTTFSFLRSSDPYHAFYQHKLAEYRNAQNQDIQPVAPATDDDAHPSLKDPPLSFPLFTRKELGVIKLTAQFVVRYGMHFWRDLMSRVINDPQFAFMEPTDSKFCFFSRLIDAYARVLRPYQKPLKNPVAVLEGFFNLIQGEKQGEGVEMHAFVGGLDYFTDMEDEELSPRGHFSTMMDSPTQMQPGMHDAPAIDPFRYPLPEPPSFPLTYPEGITPKELGIMKLTAQFVARYGLYFCQNLMKRVIDDPQFEFMKRRSGRYYFFYRLVDAYAGVLMPCQKLRKPGACLETVLEGFCNLLRGEKQEGVEMAMIGLHAFLGGNHSVANREDEELSPPGHNLSTQMLSGMPGAPATDDAERYLRPRPLQEPLRLTLYPEGISFTLKELDIIKLTARFVGVYGMSFERDLMERVTMNPQFESQFQFMKSTDSRHDFFVGLALEYSQVLPRSEKVRNNGASTATLLDGFFNILRQVLEKEEEQGVEMAHEYFVNMEYNDCRSPSQMQPPLGSQFAPRPGMSPLPPLPLPEEPDPKRPKFGESALVPEDQFLAQPLGSSTIRVSVPNFDDEQVIEISVLSLLENVASLKEKIAREIQIPADKHKLSGNTIFLKTGFLKDNMSLAHYNLGAGEVLTLSL